LTGKLAPPSLTFATSSSVAFGAETIFGLNDGLYERAEIMRPSALELL